MLDMMSLCFLESQVLLCKLVQISVHLWVTGEETISQQAFLILKDISMVFNSECFDTCLINMYKAFLHDCDIPKANSEQRPFLRDSLVELCSQDVQKSYTKASVSITQLAKLLKMALATKNKVLLSICMLFLLLKSYLICLLSLFQFL